MQSIKRGACDIWENMSLKMPASLSNSEQLLQDTNVLAHARHLCITAIRNQKGTFYEFKTDFCTTAGKIILRVAREMNNQTYSTLSDIALASSVVAISSLAVSMHVKKFSPTLAKTLNYIGTTTGVAAIGSFVLFTSQWW